MNNPHFVYIIACLLFIVFALVFAKPLKHLFKVVINSAFGCAFLMIFNFIGGIFGAFIGINAFTAITLGTLGIPGFVSILVLQFLLK